MDSTIKKLVSFLGPVIRGYFYDGESSVFVHAIEGSQAEVMLPESVIGDDAAETVKILDSIVAGYAGSNGRYPKSIGVQNVPVTFNLGMSYDEAVSGTFSREPSFIGSSRRSDIMKRKISIVTGGAQGFGAGIVQGLIDEGGFVFIADMNKEGADSLASQLNEKTGSTVALGLKVDVSSEESVEQMMDEIAALTGSIDLFVSNAGVLKAGSVKEISLRDFEFVTSVDYTGFFICTKFASRQMALQNIGSGGRYMTDIITISSKSGLEGSNKNGAYAGAKFGTIGLTQSFALELVSDNIKVNAVCPGNFLDGPLWSDPDRGLFVQYLRANKVPGAKSVEDVRAFYESKVPLSRGCKTTDVVRAICYIVEQKYETGQALPVTGGQVMLN
ncbi:MAG: SDR family NAD(P)-dependent oxidoreductase [Sphaerochaetaceae bacterium]|nr:SDR family NAD(P)-dependent oxidoreductase [Sphaerochaetaceae bacterium]